MAVNTPTFQDMREMAETLSAADKLTLSNAIFTGSLLQNEVTDRHLVVTGVNTGDVIPIMNNSANYASFPFMSQSSCETPSCDLDIDFSGKKWTLGLIGCKLEICQRQFSQDFRYFFNENLQVLHNLDLESQLFAYLTSKFKRDFAGARYRVAYFADTTTPAIDPNYDLLNGFDGWFTQAEAGNGYKIEFNQVNPTGEEMYAAFEQAYAYLMEQDWSDREDIRWKMTRKMAAIFVRWVNGLKDRSQYNCECFSPDGLTSMRTFSLDGNLSILGIPVDVERDLDGVISQLGLDRPYRALLTYRANMPIGTQTEENLNEFDIWYNKDKKMVVIEGEALIGASLTTDEYIYIGAENGTTPTT